MTGKSVTSYCTATLRLSSGSMNLYVKLELRRANSLSRSSACCLSDAVSVVEPPPCAKKALALTGASMLSSTCMVCCDRLNMRVAVTSTRVGFRNSRKLMSPTMTKNATVMMATFAP